VYDFVGSAFDGPLWHGMEGRAARLVRWSSGNGALEVIYVRSEEMLQAGWCVGIGAFKRSAARPCERKVKVV
jgi:hypothetical protein